jgi:cytochrome c oxidase subunit IV
MLISLSRMIYPRGTKINFTESIQRYSKVVKILFVIVTIHYLVIYISTINYWQQNNVLYRLLKKLFIGDLLCIVL